MYTLFDGELKLENLDTHRPAVMNGIECIVINLELSAVNVKSQPLAILPYRITNNSGVTYA